MRKVELHSSKQGFKYTLLEHRDDVTGMPLIRNLFGINNRIYANLGSVMLNEKELELYRTYYREDELRYKMVNLLYQIKIVGRRKDNDEYEELPVMDFGQLYEFTKNKKENYNYIYASYNDTGNKTDAELGVLYIPLGSDIMFNASNYAYQEFERLKMDNFMNCFTDAVHLTAFLRIFGTE